MDDSAAWALEERFWLGGPAVYEALLDPACLMALPGMGLMRAAEVIESIRAAPRWEAVVMTDRVVGRAGEGVIVLGYRAEGRRAGAAPYHAICTSTYRADGGAWKLVQHQQTPDG